ncbi:hypothetical protein D8X55_04965, partial [Malacoplasma penetrans]|uniref:DUF3713 domain-containing protein n=1 Tax=Malacoplasma penetrans TaxID=28227 RepID=UPI00101358A2
STFSTDLFANLYLSVTDSNGNYVNPTVEILQQALEDSSNTSGSYKFSFSSKALNKSVDTYVATEYANFQKFIFDQWVQSENPFMINYLQWSYSNPEEGLDAIYDKDAIGMSATSTTASASYTFPYFNNTKTNDTNSSVLKYQNFVGNASTSNVYIDTGSKAADLGLTNLNRTGLYSDDTSASYKLVINTSSYSDLQAPLALGSTYLFDTAFTVASSGSSGSGSATTGIDYTERSKLTRATATTTTGSLDPITSNFIVSDKEALKNSTLSSTGSNSNTSTSTYIPYTQIADSLVKKILSSGAYSSLTTSSGGSGGSSNGYQTANGLFAIDAFIPSNNGLNNVLFLRDSTGVYAITLDGEKYISQATTLSDAKTRAGNVVLYRHLQNKTNSNAGLSIDLSSSLSTFFTNNKDWLVYKYATSQTTQNLFDFNFLSQSEKNALNDLTTYLYIVDRYQRVETYQEAVYSNKATYSGNYGTKTVLNGFASQFPYTFTNSASANTTTSTAATIGYYKQLSTLKLENPFSDTAINSYFTTDPYDTNSGIYKKLNESISAYVSSLSISPLTSSFAGFQYSEYILTNDFFLNQAILAVGNDGNLLSDLIKKNILIDAFNTNHANALTSTDYMDYDSYELKNFTSSVTGSSSDDKDYINSALSNYFFNSTFSSSSNKWTRLKETVNTDYSDSTKSTYQTISYTSFDTYRRNMWVDSNLTYTSSSADNYVSFLTVLATIDYLLEGNGRNFISRLSSKLSDSDSNLSFLVWEGSSDANLETGKAIAKNPSSSTTGTDKYLSDATKLLYGDTTDKQLLITNNANSQSSAYYPSKSNINTYVDQNNNNSTFTDSTTSSNYYTHVADMNSFQGIQTNVSSSNISSLLTATLFTTPTTYNTNKTGLLYGYASSKENLKTLVRSYSSSQVTAFANTLGKLFNIDTSNINDVDSLTTLIDDTAKIPEDAYKPRNGYINEGNFYKDSQDNVNNMNYGSFVIQLSSVDLNNNNNGANNNGANNNGASGFFNYLKNSFSTSDPATKPTSSSTPSTPSATNSEAEKQARSVFWNLVVQLATDSSIQGTAISSLLTNTTTNRKVTVYDVRLNNQLGSRWASNYKDQSSS